MSNIYFIANNPKLDVGIFKDKWDDFCSGDVLRFNQLNFFGHFENHPRNIIYHNINGPCCSWWGLEREQYYSQFHIKDKYLYYCDDMIEQWWVTQIDGWKSRGGKLMNLRSGSAGFTCYDYFKLLYDAIFLVGFTFEGSTFHDWNCEKSVMMNDPKVKLMI